HVRLALEYVEAGAGDLALLERARQRRLVDDRSARGIDQESCRLHQGELARADLVAGLGSERGMQRDEIGLLEQLPGRQVGPRQLVLAARRLARRRPIEPAHADPGGAARPRRADASAAAHQSDGLAVDRRPREMARLRAWKAALVN